MQKKMKPMVSHSKAHNNIEEKYIRQVWLLLPRTKNGKAFLTGLKKDLHAYLCKYPDSTIDDIYEVYGTPTNAVQYYLREQNEEDLKQSECLEIGCVGNLKGRIHSLKHDFNHIDFPVCKVLVGPEEVL